MRPAINIFLQDILDKRKEQSLYRSLQIHQDLTDFCSNDYLSFARRGIKDFRSGSLELERHLAGATGSRSISGNSAFAEELESELAAFHQAEAGLLFNSGYDANLGLFSCIARKEDMLICDELIHASIIDGCRLSYAGRLRFAHNDVLDLEKKLKHVQTKSIEGSVFVAIESVYSMDGDMAPLREIAALCKKYHANLIVDEAHATGVFGPRGGGLVSQYGLEQEVFARVHTFGKAMGCHGAVIVGSDVLRNYLINFARSFIFTTALPLHALVNIKDAYGRLAAGDFCNSHLHQLIEHFKMGFPNREYCGLIESISPVQSLIIPGNERARQASRRLQQAGFDVRAILSPSVSAGKERLRISLHMHNTFEEVDRLKLALNDIL